MKHCGQLIERILDDKQIKKKDLAKGIGVAPQRIAKLLLEPTIDCKLLEDICKYFEIAPTDFFDYNPNSDESIGMNTDIKQNVGIGHAEVNMSDSRLIDKLLATYDARIEGYEAQIRSLESTVSVLRSLLSGKIDTVG